MNKKQKTRTIVGAHDCAQRTRNIAGRMQYAPCHGITLIALIITIILILILAGVVINMTTSTEGLVQKATEAKEKTEQSQKTEKEMIEDLNSYIEIFESPWDGTVGTQFAGGEGTQASPYIIETAEELAYLAQQVNSGETFEGKYIKIVKAINLGNQKWTPIALGKEGSRAETEWNMTERSFKGHLDGNGNMIANINVEEISTHGVGLIGVLEEGGTVENVNLYGGRIIGRTCVGGIVGASKGTVTNCNNKVEIIAQDDINLSNSGQMAGGIVGWIAKGTIENCENNGSILVKNDAVKTGRGKYVGGIVGYINGESVSIKECINNGIVTATYEQAGGIAGGDEYISEPYTIENCVNMGKIVTKDIGITTKATIGLTGGIIGLANKGTIKNCKNEGIVISECAKDGGNDTGGIAGYSEEIIESCTNRGSVKGDWLAGGIVGYNYGTIRNCANEGNVETENYGDVGGIAGYSQGTIEKCTNNGNINGNRRAGGIIGWLEGGTTIECANGGNVLAESWASGGIAGWIYGGTITQCTNRGNITVNVWDAGGIAGGQEGGTITSCTNKGIIVAKDEAGGITGYQWGGILENCINEGDIIAQYNKEIEDSGMYSGGIAGYQDEGTITNCINQGKVVAEAQQAGGIAGAQGEEEYEAMIQECSNVGRVEAKSEGTNGIAGGIVGEQNGANVTVTNVYNSGEVIVASEANEEISANGGIIGRQVLGTLSNAYNRGKLTGGDALGGVIGCQNLAGTVEKTYYTNSELKGIGSKTDSTTEITPAEDEAGKTEKVTEIIETFEKFLTWIATK